HDDDRHRCERRAPAYEFEQPGIHRVEEDGENRRPRDRRQKRRQDQERAVQSEQKKREEKSGHEPSSIHRVASSPIRQLYVEELSVARRHKRDSPCGESLSASIAVIAKDKI